MAGFLGISNLITGAARPLGGDRCAVTVGEFELHAAGGKVSRPGQTKLMIRPERVQIEPHGASGENRIPGIVERVVYRGNADQVFIRLPAGDSVQVLVQNVGGDRRYEAGDAVRLFLPEHAQRVLEDTGGPNGGDEAQSQGSKDLVST